MPTLLLCFGLLGLAVSQVLIHWSHVQAYLTGIKEWSYKDPNAIKIWLVIGFIVVCVACFLGVVV